MQGMPAMQRSSSFSTAELPILHKGIKVVKPSVRQRAQSASNFASGAPFNLIKTDERGIVLTVTPAFCEFTGYDEDEMVGKKCSFLQGEETDPEDVQDLRMAMREKRQTSVVILNFCKDGRPFWNLLTIIPVFRPNSSDLMHYNGEVINFEIPLAMRSYPRLCVDDALALISVYSSIPRVIGDRPAAAHVVVDESVLEHSGFKAPQHAGAGLSEFETSENEGDGRADAAAGGRRLHEPSGAATADAGTTQPPSSGTYYKHQNYASRFADEAGACEPAPGRYMFIAETGLPTKLGRFRCRAYRDCASGAEPLAMVVGNVEGRSDVIVRVHDQCVTSEVFASLRCDCKEQLDFAMGFIQENEGIVIYLPQEGRGIGIANKINAYAAQERGMDTVEANRFLGLPDDARQYESVRDILADLNVRSIRLLSNNPRKFSCLSDLGIIISDRLPCVVTPNSEYAMKYVHSKAEKMGHMINIKSLSSDFSRTVQTPPRPRSAPSPDVEPKRAQTPTRESRPTGGAPVPPVRARPDAKICADTATSK